MMVRRRKDLEHARAEHDRYIDPDKATRDNEFIVESRSEDNSFWWRTSWYLQKYLAAWVPFVTLGAALGFSFITPKRSADELRAHGDSTAAVLQRRINTLEVQQSTLRATLDTNTRNMTLLVRMACLQKTVSNYDKRLVGLLDAAGECIR
jgi:hypothetical protein